MGIGTLRRYHPTIDPALKEAAKADPDPEVREHQRAIDEASAALDAAREAATAAVTASNDSPDDEGLAAAGVAAVAAAQEAQAHLEAVQTAFEDQKAREALYADAPARSASKGTWTDYAASHGRPAESLVDEDGKALTRDAIAELYLGPKG